jgi:hypothetical protein
MRVHTVRSTARSSDVETTWRSENGMLDGVEAVLDVGGVEFGVEDAKELVVKRVVFREIGGA